VAPSEFAALNQEEGSLHELKLHVHYVRYMRGSETVAVERDMEEEALLREQRARPKLKLGIKLRTAAP
jgi:hypothetical protein